MDEAVAEVSVQTAVFGVEFGRAGGGVFNLITKSGTNNIHGTLFGDRKTVWRGGYQISYDGPFTNLIFSVARGADSKSRPRRLRSLQIGRARSDSLRASRTPNR